MNTETATSKGTAEAQGKLWGARSDDWATIQEPLTRPLFEAALRDLNLGQRSRVLEVGCGAGLAANIASSFGANVTAIDAAARLIEIARKRTPDGDFRVGEMEELPFDDHQFDAVIGFNSFQYAASPVHALREAKRVAKRDGRLLVAVWGEKDRCEAAVFLAALGSCLPPPPPGAPGPFALSAPGALESLIAEAGWTSIKRASVAVPFDYPDEPTAMRGLLAAGPAVRAIQNAGEQRVRAATLAAIQPYRKRSGGYRMENEFVYLIAK